jgi:hypothetical protein
MLEILPEGMTTRTRETVMRGVKTLDPILAHGNLLRFIKLQKCRLVRRGQWPLMNMAQTSSNTSMTLCSY